jgi:hypothetical protein
MDVGIPDVPDIPDIPVPEKCRYSSRGGSQEGQGQASQVGPVELH